MSDELLDNLMNALSGRKTLSKNTTVRHSGSEIILPVINGVKMSYDEAIHWLLKRKEEDETEVKVYHEIKASPLDGAVALQKAIAETYGWSNGVPTPGFFGSNPPHMIAVQTSPTEKTNVPWGRIEIPGIDGYIETSMKPCDANPIFLVTGKVKKKHAENVKDLMAKVQEVVRNQSIYKGKAVKLSFAWYRQDYDEFAYDITEDCPQFMNLSGTSDTDLIFGKSVQDALDIGLFTPIEQAEACRENGIPLKRGVLLYGPYGTGKTMTAYVSALKAVRNDWTFIYLDSVEDLREGLKFAAQYAPAVVFAEDIDRLIHGKRSMEMDEVLNILDGIDTKGGEIITVLTTNHIENINPAMLRPGRLDTLVEVSPPDAKAAEKLVTLYGRGLLAEDVDLSKVGKTLAGNIPAFIREVTERAKIAAVARTGSKEIKGLVTEKDLLAAANAMEIHANMLKPKEDDFKDTTSILVEFGGDAKNNGKRKVAKAS